jgi:hypothetical protein
MSSGPRVNASQTCRNSVLASIRMCLLTSSLWVSMIFTSANGCVAQTVPPPDQWGEHHNSPGATLSYKETARSLLNGKTVVTYNLFASGLPTDGQYVLSTVIIGATPIKVGEVRLTEEGKIVNATADPAHNIVAGEPFVINLLAPKGQPFQFAVVSTDERSRAFTRIIPFPIEADTGPCHLSVEEIIPAYAGILIHLSGLQSNETVVLKCNCGKKGYETKGTADEKGIFKAAVETGVKGKQSGTFEFELKAQSCKVGMQIPWGRATEKFQ